MHAQGTTQGQQRIVELFRIAHHRPRFVDDLLDGGLIQRAHLACQPGQSPPHVDRPRPALLQRSVVEKRVGIGIQDFMTKTEGKGVSMARQAIAPRSMRSSTAINPSRSIASVKQSRMVS